MERTGAGRRGRLRARAAAHGPLWAHACLPEVHAHVVAAGRAEPGACLQHSGTAAVPAPIQ